MTGTGIPLHADIVRTETRVRSASLAPRSMHALDLTNAEIRHIHAWTQIWADYTHPLYDPCMQIQDLREKTETDALHEVYIHSKCQDASLYCSMCLVDRFADAMTPREAPPLGGSTRKKETDENNSEF